MTLVAWLVTASNDTVGQVLLVGVRTFVVGVGHFAHSVAGSGDVLTAVFTGSLPFTSYLTWISGAVLGNNVGVVFIVAVLPRPRPCSRHLTRLSTSLHVQIAHCRTFVRP